MGLTDATETDEETNAGTPGNSGIWLADGNYRSGIFSENNQPGAIRTRDTSCRRETPASQPCSVDPRAGPTLIAANRRVTYKHRYIGKGNETANFADVRVNNIIIAVVTYCETAITSREKRRTRRRRNVSQ